MITPAQLEQLTTDILQAKTSTQAASLFVRRINVCELSEEQAMHGIETIAQAIIRADGGQPYRSQQFQQLAEIRCYHAWGL